VRFTSAVALAQELLAAQDEHRLPRYLKSWQKTDLAIVDELGYLGLGPGGPLLFQFFAERYEKGSVLVTSNLEFSRWSEVFGDPVFMRARDQLLAHPGGYRVFAEILMLGMRFDLEVLAQALEECLASGRLSVEGVRQRCLNLTCVAPGPVLVPELLALRLPRPDLTRYDALAAVAQ